MLNESNAKGLAMVTNKVEGIRFKSQQGKSNLQPRSQNQEVLWCTYCKKPKHTQEACFKLQGKETILSKMGDFRSLSSKNQAYLTTKEQEEATTNKANLAITSDLSQLNADEISKLKSFLRTIQDGTCSLA